MITNLKTVQSNPEKQMQPVCSKNNLSHYHILTKSSMSKTTFQGWRGAQWLEHLLLLQRNCTPVRWFIIPVPRDITPSSDLYRLLHSNSHIHTQTDRRTRTHTQMHVTKKINEKNKIFLMSSFTGHGTIYNFLKV